MSSTSRSRAEAAAWSRFECAAPELASVGRRLFEKHEIAYLATVSRQGRPRIHPFCPALAEGRLWAFIMEGSPKRTDLDANGLYSMHALPGPEDEEFFIGGSARRDLDPATRTVVVEAMPYDDADERHLLYEFRIERALWTLWENFQKPGMRPVYRRWRA